MPSYGGFRDLPDYILKRSKQSGKSLRELSEEMRFSHSYLNNIVTGKITNPKKKSLDIMARHFGDSPRLVRVLGGVETPIIEDGQDRVSASILDVAMSLSAMGRQKLLEFANFLKGQEREK